MKPALKSLTVFLALLAAIAAGLFLAVFILIPRYQHQPIIPVYSADFESTMAVDIDPRKDGSPAISGRVTTATGRPVPALVRLFNAPRTSRELDIAAQSYTDREGSFSLQVAPGDYEILIYKGPEYEYFIQPVTVGTNQALALDIALHQIIDMAGRGWFAGDPHQHSAYYDGADEIPDLLLRLRDVSLVETLCYTA